jgi:hypothetical protein
MKFMFIKARLLFRMLKDYLKLAELAWKPYRWGTYDLNADSTDMRALDSALQRLASRGWVRIPHRGCE